MSLCLKITKAGLRWVTWGGRRFQVADKGSGGGGAAGGKSTAASKPTVKNEGQIQAAAHLDLTRKYPKEFPPGSKVTTTTYSSTSGTNVKDRAIGSRAQRSTATVHESQKADFAVVSVSRAVSGTGGQQWADKTFRGPNSTLEAHRHARKTLEE